MKKTFNVNLAAMDNAQVAELIDAAEQELQTRKEKQLELARLKVKEIARDLGVSVEELAGVKSGDRPKRRPAAIKYRHPNNPELVWSGRGRMANWLKEELASGNTLDDFLVDGMRTE